MRKSWLYWYTSSFNKELTFHQEIPFWRGSTSVEIVLWYYLLFHDHVFSSLSVWAESWGIVVVGILVFKANWSSPLLRRSLGRAVAALKLTFRPIFLTTCCQQFSYSLIFSLSSFSSSGLLRSSNHFAPYLKGHLSLHLTEWTPLLGLRNRAKMTGNGPLNSMQIFIKM